MVEHLIDVAGAQVNVLDRWGGTPLADAIRHRHEKVADALDERGGMVRSEAPMDHEELCDTIARCTAQLKALQHRARPVGPQAELGKLHESLKSSAVSMTDSILESSEYPSTGPCTSPTVGSFTSHTRRAARRGSNNSIRSAPDEKTTEAVP